MLALNVDKALIEENEEKAIAALSENGYEIGEYNPHKVSAYLIQTQSTKVIGIGSNLQEALDYAVDNNLLDAEKMSDEDYTEYSGNGWDDSYALLGNASEPFWTEHMAVGLLITA